MRGINSKAALCSQGKNNLEIKAGSDLKFRVKKENVFASRGCFNEAIK